jgi:hypothetical protein
LTENQVLKQLEALPALLLRKTIKYTIPGIELSLEGSAAGNMIKTAAKIKKSQMLSIVLMETLRLKPSCHARLFKHSFHRSSRERPSND